jgi:hypothetical protein
MTRPVRQDLRGVFHARSEAGPSVGSFNIRGVTHGALTGPYSPAAAGDLSQGSLLRAQEAASKGAAFDDDASSRFAACHPHIPMRPPPTHLTPGEPVSGNAAEILSSSRRTKGAAAPASKQLRESSIRGSSTHAQRRFSHSLELFLPPLRSRSHVSSSPFVAVPSTCCTDSTADKR